MRLTSQQEELKQRVEVLIDSGCHYQIDKLQSLYSKDLKVVMISPDGEVMAMDYEQVMGMFEHKKSSGEPAMSTEATFNYIEVDGDDGHVVVTRNVALMGTLQEVVFNLTLSIESGDWKVTREFAVITKNI